MVWAGVLSFLAAAIVGVLPALRATRGKGNGASRVVGTSVSGLRFGTTWTTLIVVQVGFAIAVLSAAVFSVWESMRSGLTEPGFATTECLTARVKFDPGPDGRMEALLRQLAAEPQLTSVAYSSPVPGDEPAVRLEVEGGAADGF
jgi:hypothetical protein